MEEIKKQTNPPTPKKNKLIKQKRLNVFPKKKIKMLLSRFPISTAPISSRSRFFFFHGSFCFLRFLFLPLWCKLPRERTRAGVRERNSKKPFPIVPLCLSVCLRVPFCPLLKRTILSRISESDTGRNPAMNTQYSFFFFFLLLHFLVGYVFPNTGIA